MARPRGTRQYLRMYFPDRASDAMHDVILGWTAAQTGSPGSAAFVISMGVVPQIVFGIWGGALADRIGVVRVARATFVLQMVFLLGYAAVLTNDQPATLAVAALAAGMGLVDALNSASVGAVAGLLGDEGNSEGQSELQALSGAVGRTAVILGTPAAGALLAWQASSAPVAAAGFVLIALAMLFQVQGYTRPHEPADPDVSTLSMIREGVSVVMSDPTKRLILVAFSAVNFLMTPPLLLAMPLMATEYDWGSLAYGCVFAASAAGGILGGLSLAKWRKRVTRPLRAAFLALVPGVAMLVVFVTADNPWQAGIGVFLASFCNAPAPALLIGEMRGRTESRLMGRVMSLQTMAIYSLIPVGHGVYAVLAAATSLQTASLIFCAALTVAALGALAAEQRLNARFGELQPEQAD